MKNILPKIAFVGLLFLMNEVACGKNYFYYEVTGADTSIWHITGSTYYAYYPDTVIATAGHIDDGVSPDYYGPWDWYCDSIFIQRSDSLLITHNGKYWVREQFGYNGKPFTVIFSGEVSTINGLSSDETLRIYPNPFSSSLHISLNLGNSSRIDFKLFDVIGNEIYTVTFSSANELNKDVDLAFLPAGVYAAILTMDDKKMVKKIIKSR